MAECMSPQIPVRANRLKAQGVDVTDASEIRLTVKMRMLYLPIWLL